jgi:hypothetical protein
VAFIPIAKREADHRAADEARSDDAGAGRILVKENHRAGQFDAQQGHRIEGAQGVFRARNGTAPQR